MAMLSLNACGLYDTPQAIYVDEPATRPDGQPAECGDPCGTCGLGHYTCERGLDKAYKIAQCVEPQIPGLDPTQCDTQLRKVFARDQSLSSLTGVKAILLQDGLVLDGFELPSGASLIGGFRPDWTYNPRGQSIIRSSQRMANGDSYGLRLNSSSTAVQVSHLRIEVRPQDQGPPGSSSYGLYVRRVPDLELLDVHILAASGQDGQKGEDGLAGEPGGDGAAFVGPLMCISNSYTPVAPGTNPSCPEDTEGGLGGRGALVLDQSMNASGAQGLPQELGGAGGNAQFGLALAGRRPPPLDIAAQDGLVSLSSGHVNAQGFWQPDPPDEAARGQDGAHGAGGGGGGGSSANPQGQGLFCQGTPGASGGAGGCGGKGGQSGQPGGSSFGLFVLDSQVTLERCLIEGHAPGRGGRGGKGGIGGQGGKGGASSVPTATGLSVVYPSAAGGDGARGQRGGDGARGPDGLSFGAYCQNSRLFYEGSEGNTFFRVPPTSSQLELAGVSATFNCLQ